MATSALKAKEKGNAAFKAEKYPEAVGRYTEAILADSSEPTYPLNRAAAYLKLGKAIDAERDCSTVLQLVPGHVKALFRRAQARVELGTLKEAKSDLVDALKREPGNDAVTSEIQKVDKLLSEQRIRKSSPIDITAVLPPSIPQRRRVPIEIVEKDNLLPSSVRSTDPLIPISFRSLQRKPEDALPTPLPSPGQPMSKLAEATVSTPQNPVKPTSIRGGIFRTSGQHTIFRTPETSLPQPILKHSSASKVSNVKPEDMPIPAPMSLFDFVRMWDLASPTERWDLLCRITPQALPSLFKASLEAPLLFQILEVCSLAVNSTNDPSIKSRIREYLRWLQRVPRFSTVALFLNKQERELAGSLAADVGADGYKL